MSCSHTRHVPGYWEPDPYSDDGEQRYVRSSEESTTVDIDLHRYRCTQCGQVFYYSQAAREYHEEGKLHPWIRGLDGKTDADLK